MGNCCEKEKGQIVSSIQEQRHAKRMLANWPVSVWHPLAARFFNGRSANISASGVLLELPMKAPIQEGQAVEVNFPRSDKLNGQACYLSHTKKARVIRIDRVDSIQSASIKVGLAFDRK